MPEIEHNAPRFQYRISYKRNIPGEEYQIVDIPDWTQNRYVVNNQPTFQKYRIKVVAMNEMGRSNVAAKEVIGYSGEDVPLLAPTNFTLLKIHAPTKALLKWDPVPVDSVRGHFKGYKIEVWTDSDTDKNHTETQVEGDATRALVAKFIPHTKNYAKVFVYNGQYNGPPSEILSFDTREGSKYIFNFIS